ncbi:hypothetical protein ANN_02400 [Periplaneta americana]|uniref:DUF4817 domain-containing protein n=1 Tax=Periplaneta americana TaxID=6978 RepID=A0ABQ8TZF4_PERAM|nr:hypothetical protein ANN_02400 [Periplaneta americana]
MAGLCEGGNEPPGSLKASKTHFDIGCHARIPTRNTILRWVASFRITGSTLKKKSSGRNSIALRLSEATLPINWNEVARFKVYVTSQRSTDKKKLMMAFFALMMVIKMIKVKLMFLLPMLLGVGTAKKIFLKLLLFVFPAFAHIFKFCAYYHAAHTKYHHHHHQRSEIIALDMTRSKF